MVDKVKGPKNPHPNRVSSEIEAAILDHALAHPTHGPMRVAHELALRGLQVSSGGVRGVWSRHDLLTKHERLLRLEKATAERPIELTPEQARLLERFSPEFRERHIEAPHDNGREFCGRPDQHPYELFLQLEGIAHKTIRVGRPQSTLPAACARCAHDPRGSIERLHRTLLDEHLRVQGRTVWHETVAEMQTALDAFLLRYNRERPHQGRGMNGRTPLQAFLDGLPVRPEPAQESQPEPIAA